MSNGCYEPPGKKKVIVRRSMLSKRRRVFTDTEVSILRKLFSKAIRCGSLNENNIKEVLQDSEHSYLLSKYSFQQITSRLTYERRCLKLNMTYEFGGIYFLAFIVLLVSIIFPLVHKTEVKPISILG